MVVWILVTQSNTGGTYQYWVKSYLDITQGRINQPTASEVSNG